MRMQIVIKICRQTKSTIFTFLLYCFQVFSLKREVTCTPNRQNAVKYTFRILIFVNFTSTWSLSRRAKSMRIQIRNSDICKQHAHQCTPPSPPFFPYFPPPRPCWLSPWCVRGGVKTTYIYVPTHTAYWHGVSYAIRLPCIISNAVSIFMPRGSKRPSLLMQVLVRRLATK